MKFFDAVFYRIPVQQTLNGLCSKLSRFFSGENIACPDNAGHVARFCVRIKVPRVVDYADLAGFNVAVSQHQRVQPLKLMRSNLIISFEPTLSRLA